MEEFGYLSVLVSIIVGLGVAQILTGFRGLLQSRASVRLYWPNLMWSVLLLLVFVQTWWSMFGLQTHRDWSFQSFAVLLLHTTLLYMTAGLVLPDFYGGTTVDLREHYYRHHRWFFGLLVAVAFVSIGKDLVIDGTLPNRTNLAFHLVFIALVGTAAVTGQEWYHKFLAVAGTAIFVTYIGVLFVHLH